MIRPIQTIIRYLRRARTTAKRCDLPGFPTATALVCAAKRYAVGKACRLER
jgi:hypothetical protein